MPTKVSLTRVRINNGGYDDTGYYWGVGQPLYCAIADEWDYAKYVRADSREDAKEEIRAMCPGQTLAFYR